MTGAIQKIILTADYLQDGNADYEDLNTDVIVQFENGDKYVAAFYSWKNLENMIKELEPKDEYRSGRFYKVLNMVLVRDFDQGDIRPIIDAMLAEGDFQLVFRKL
ncbi:MAG TPA: hypothetical protein VKZ86_00360 [Cyclobacteriaceae bacterium]|nr:hypothetical protein [Cyclobacteriaceae bacterium]